MSRTSCSRSPLAIVVVAAALGLTSGCGDDDAITPPMMDGGTPDADSGPPSRIEDLPVQEERSLAGLESAVEVVTDDRGMPHIYASNLHDASLVQGYIEARDRMGQMEFFRRLIAGTLGEITGAIGGTTVLNLDISARVLQHHRIAEQRYAALADGSDEKAVLDALTQGINAYITRLRAGEVYLPRGVADILDPAAIADWAPADSLAVLQYLIWDQSYGNAPASIWWSQNVAAARAAFPAADPDARIAARANVFEDFFAFYPAVNVFTREGFPNVTTDTGTRALRPPPVPSVRAPYDPPPSSVLAAATAFFRLVDHGNPIGDETRGSNDWVVHGSKTASGGTLLASDPHLQLRSPPLFWYVHLNTVRYGGGDFDVEGITAMSLPGVVIGHNRDIAWGMTNAYADSADVYEETITAGTGGAPDTVLFRGAQVAIEQRTETIRLDTGRNVDIVLESVPHHGPIIPQIRDGAIVPRSGATALSVRWKGYEIRNEVGAMMRVDRAKSIEEARMALASGWAAIPLSFVFASRDNHVMWTTRSAVPVRAPAALTYDPVTQTGYTPCLVLPGTGEYEWLDGEAGELSDRYLPHDIDPARGFIATANNDLVGATEDGDPLNDGVFFHCNTDIGHRIARITDRLTELTTRGGVTPEEMSAVQGDHFSPLGERLSPAFIAAVNRALAERDAPGTHADLSAVVAAAGADRLTKLAAARDRLMAWTSHQAPAAVEGSPPADEIADSVATSIFNAALARLYRLAFLDETERLAPGMMGAYSLAKTLEVAILEPTKLATYDAALGDTVLWDDLDTTEVESRDERIVRAMLDGIDFLEGRLGADPNAWRWGALHTLRLLSVIPSLTTDRLSIPTPDDAMFPNGFPRGGDNHGIDAANYSPYDGMTFAYGSGPQQRLVVEFAPSGVRAWNALPGGESEDPDSPHHADEAEHWRKNEAPPLYFEEADVVAHAEMRERFIP